MCLYTSANFYIQDAPDIRIIPCISNPVDFPRLYRNRHIISIFRIFFYDIIRQIVFFRTFIRIVSPLKREAEKSRLVKNNISIIKVISHASGNSCIH